MEMEVVFADGLNSGLVLVRFTASWRLVPSAGKMSDPTPETPEAVMTRMMPGVCGKLLEGEKVRANFLAGVTTAVAGPTGDR